MITYNPNIIQKFADKLYARARIIAVIYAILGLIIGFIAGFYFLRELPGEMSLGVRSLLTAVIFGLIGLALGEQRGFMLKLQAQTALCQLQIEKNTKSAQT